MCLRCGARCVARQKPVIVGVRPGVARRADDAGQAGVGPAAYGLYNGRSMSSSPRHLLQTVRSLHGLARLALAWFVLSLGVAVASPWVSPQSIELICAGSGAIKVLIKTDDGARKCPPTRSIARCARMSAHRRRSRTPMCQWFTRWCMRCARCPRRTSRRARPRRCLRVARLFSPDYYIFDSCLRLMRKRYRPIWPVFQGFPCAQAAGHWQWPVPFLSSRRRG